MSGRFEQFRDRLGELLGEFIDVPAQDVVDELELQLDALRDQVRNEEEIVRR